MSKIISKKLLIIIFLLGLFLPIFDAEATSIFSIGNITYEAVSFIFSYAIYIMFTTVGWLLALMVKLLAQVVNIRIYTNVPVIQVSWKIMRDFANMLFIIALIVMAYGTIFNIPKYDFKSLIPRFIVVAVLINFSLVLGGLIIDATQFLNYNQTTLWYFYVFHHFSKRRCSSCRGACQNTDTLGIAYRLAYGVAFKYTAGDKRSVR